MEPRAAGRGVEVGRQHGWELWGCAVLCCEQGNGMGCGMSGWVRGQSHVGTLVRYCSWVPRDPCVLSRQKGEAQPR